MRAMIVLFVLALACVGSFAGESDTAICQPFIERNETCREAVLEECRSAVKVKMLEQIESVPADFREEMRQNMDQNVQGFCDKFIAQTTGDQALGMCRETLGGSDPAIAKHVSEMKTCLAKETCREYADCAVSFE